MTAVPSRVLTHRASGAARTTTLGHAMYGPSLNHQTPGTQ